MELQLLGSVHARLADGRPVNLGVRRQRFLLAVLALEVNHLITTQRLIDLTWPDRPPASARAVIQTNISGLRSLLARAGAEDEGIRVITDGPGYLLRWPPEHIDVCRFRTLLHEADGITDEYQRLSTLERALDLWRGPVLAGVCDEGVRSRLGGWLEQARLDAVEERIAIQLHLAPHRRLAEELIRLVDEHPTRHRLVAQLMLALYRDGRTEEALAVYRRASSRLADRVGLDPPEMLQGLQVAILRQDPALLRFGTRYPEPARAPRSAPMVIERAVDNRRHVRSCRPAEWRRTG